MNCKHCGFSQAIESPLCPNCGAWVIRPVPGLPAPKKSRARLPYLILLAMLLAGTILFFLIPSAASDRSEALPETQAVLPNGKTVLQSDCFLLENGTLYFDESRFIPNPILIIPSAVEQEPVSVIGESCFAGLEGVTTVILPGSVTVIEDRAFAGCTDLRGICLPNTAQSIGREAFRGCKNLEAVYLPTGLSSIGADAFSDCPTLRYIFYNGLYEEWQQLYPDTITPFTWAICWDGEYQHVGRNP